MLSEPMTLYKLMVLHMLKKVNFPLSNSQLGDFFSSHNYANYFTFQQVINDLLEANLIIADTIRNTTTYELTKEGDDVLYFFGKQVSQSILNDIDDFISKNKYQMRNEVGITADYYKSNLSDYTVHCVIKEGHSNLMELNISVPTEEQAIEMCDKWSDCHEELYSYIMKRML